MKTYFVYIMTNEHNAVLYVGMTNDLIRRSGQHRSGRFEGFTKRYGVRKLVYFETTENVTAAIEREKQLKAGRRAKKIELINSKNPNWDDLYDEIANL